MTGYIRRFGFLALVLVLALLGFACGGGDTSTPSGANQALNVGFTEDQYVLEGADAGLGM